MRRLSLPVVLLLMIAACLPGAARNVDTPLRLHTRTLPNGLLVAVVENPSVPLATVEIGVHNGSMNEPLPLNGLSHLYEHMFFKGNAVIPDQLAYMARLRQLGASWNGTTGTERVDYFFTVGADQLDGAMKFMSDAIKSPRFDAEELRREKQVVLGEFDRNEANPDYYLDHAITYALFYKYPTYKDPLGTRASIQAATVEQMRWMQQVYYIPNNSILVVTGDVKADRVFALAQRWFADWKQGPDPFIAHPLVTHPPLPASKALVVAQPVETATIRLDWQGPSTATDLKGAVVADVFSYALDEDGSRFQKALVDSGLAAHADIGYNTLRNTGQITISIQTTPEKALQAARVALQEVRHFGDPDYITEDQWRSAQTLLAVRDLYDRERMSEFAHTLTFWFAVANLQAYQDYIPAIRHYTRADGAQYAGRYMVGRPLVLSAMASPEAEKKNGISEASLQQLLSTAWASRMVLGYRGGPEVESFEVDGIPVLLRHNEATPVVSVATFFRGGVLNLTPQTQGIEHLALDVATNGGAAGLTREERSKKLDAMGTDLSASTAFDYSRIDMKCVREFFDPSFDLYAAGIAHPAFASADVELFRRQTLNEIREAHADPDEEVRRISELFAFRDHPYALRQSGTIETVSKFTPAQVADYFKRLAARSSMLVVAVGNIDRPHLEAALHRNFASLPEGEPRTAAPPPLVPRPTALTTEERDLPTAYVRGVIPAVSPTDPRFPAQYLTADILASRLFEEVRTRRNLSYAVWSGLAERRANNMTLYVTSTKPTEAVAVMRQTVRELAERPLTPDQLKGYVATLITNYYLGIETSEDQANQLGHEQIVAGDWRRTFTFVDAIREVTPAQVQAEARRMLEGGAQWAILGKVKGLDQGGFLGQPQK